MSSGYYSRDEVTRIIRRAMQLQTRDEIGRDELIDIAKDLGIDAATIEKAIAQEMLEKTRNDRIKAWQKSRKFGFHWHLWSYLVTNGALVLVNSLLPGPWWFQWPMIGWGIGLVFHFQSVYFPNQGQIKRGFRKQAVVIHPE